MKTSELTGDALEWCVAKCVGRGYPYPASTDWSVGGPIIEREYITIASKLVGEWNAFINTETKPFTPLAIYNGSTPLIAAMRCYCASKLGDEVEVPEELT